MTKPDYIMPTNQHGCHDCAHANVYKTGTGKERKCGHPDVGCGNWSRTVQSSMICERWSLRVFVRRFVPKL